MELNDVEISKYTLEELDTEADKLQNELKHARDELDESFKQLTQMKKKQKVVQIRNALKELLAKNQEQIKQIDADIKVMQQGKSESDILKILYIIKLLLSSSVILFPLGHSVPPSSQEESAPDVFSAGESEGNIQFLVSLSTY